MLFLAFLLAFSVFITVSFGATTASTTKATSTSSKTSSTSTKSTLTTSIKSSTSTKASTISTKSSSSTKATSTTKASSATKSTSSSSTKATSTTKASSTTESTSSSSTKASTTSKATSSSSSSTKASTTSKATTSSASSTKTTSTSTSATSAKSVASPYAINTGKRGLPYGNESYTDFFSLEGDNSKVSWAYNYYSVPNPDINPALAYIPMLWSSADDLTSVFEANVKTSVAEYGADALLGFNEPDECYNSGQACMNVSEAVTAWKTYIEPLAGYEDILLGAPAVTNGGTGLPWLSQFLGNCTDCTVDFVPIHWYSSVYAFQYFQSYVNESHQAALAGGVPGGKIWVTEFGMDSEYGTDSQYYNNTLIEEFIMEAVSWLDEQDYVERYAWFGDYEATSSFSGLANYEGTGLSANGVLFNNYTAPYACGGLGNPCST